MRRIPKGFHIIPYIIVIITLVCLQGSASEILSVKKQNPSKSNNELNFLFIHLASSFNVKTYWEIDNLRVTQLLLKEGGKFKPRVISDSEMTWVSPSEKSANNAYIGEIELYRHFPVAIILARPSSVDDVRRITNVLEVEQVSISRAIFLRELFRKFDDILEESEYIETINLSMQIPPEREEKVSQKNTINLIYRILFDHGISIVVAAGNYGGLGDGVMNPLAASPWVISVGAAYADGQRLWEYSSRGIAGDPILHPTVVAPGVNVESKEGSTTLTGTSFATPVVTGIAFRCRKFIKDRLLNSETVHAWEEEYESQYGTNPRPVVSNAMVIKRMVQDMAIPMPKYRKHEVGAGFVDSEIADRYLANFNYENYLRVFQGPPDDSSALDADAIHRDR